MAARVSLQQSRQRGDPSSQEARRNTAPRRAKAKRPCEGIEAVGVHDRRPPFWPEMLACAPLFRSAHDGAQMGSRAQASEARPLSSIRRWRGAGIGAAHLIGMRQTGHAGQRTSWAAR